MERDEEEKTTNFRKHLVLNLLDREIGSQQRKYASIESTYRHPHQLVVSKRPRAVYEFNLDRCEPPTDSPVKFSTLADCLGFSPDGKHLAFHSHARTAITVLQYSGVEGGKCAGTQPSVAHFFGGKQKFDLTQILSAWRYDHDRAYGSWWTDDSSTIIIQLKITALELEDLLRMDGEEMVQVNVALQDERAQWRVVGQNNTSQPPNRFTAPGRPSERNATGNYMNRQRRAQVVPEEDLEINVTSDDEDMMNSSQDDNGQAAASNSNMTCELLDQLEGEERVFQNGETSRTIPYWLAMESASEMRKDSKKATGQTSRTMTVYHAVTSSIPAEGQSSNGEGQHHKDLLNPASSEPEIKRMKMASDKSVSRDSSSFINTPHRHDQNGDLTEKGTISKSLQKWIAKSKGNIYFSKKDGTNRSGLGYSSPSSFVRRAQRLTETTPRVNESYADQLRQAIEEQRSLNPPIRVLPDIENANQTTDSKISFVFLAYNVKTGRVAPMIVGNVFRKFDCHMRDRTLTAAYNNDFVDTYHLIEKDFRWARGPRFRLANLNSVVCPQYYRPGTVPGMPSMMPRPDMEGICGELYNFYEFLSPVQQSTKALLYRDLPEWFNINEVFRTEKPTLTRCHMIADNVIAITMTFHSHPSNKPIHQGVIVNLAEQSFQLYPDYLKFMQLLFTHHLSELLPRHWTYLNPAPVIYQPWFKESLIDVSNPEHMNNYARLKRVYDLMCEHWTNVKSTSNPLSDGMFFSGLAGDNYLTRFVYSHPDEDSTTGVRTRSTEHILHFEKFFHPTDPLVIWNHVSRWFVAVPATDPVDVVVK